jgi:hypothetical protein
MVTGLVNVAILIKINSQGGDIMPNFDRSGPNGQGPMTGRGAGYCAGNEQPAPRWGRGLGRFFGNRGFGRNFIGGAGYNAPSTNVQEEDALRQQQSWLQNQLESISQRIEQLISAKNNK